MNGVSVGKEQPLPFGQRGPELAGVVFSGPADLKFGSIDDVSPGVLFSYFLRPIRRVIVNDDDLEVDPVLIQKRSDTLAQAILFIASRDDDRDRQVARGTLTILWVGAQGW